MTRLFRVVLVAFSFSVASAALAGAGFAGLSFSVSKETAPPGGMAQVKIFLTEPKPISTGGAKMRFDAYDAVLGIALAPELRDACGVALVRGTAIDVFVLSPTGTFGTVLDYPLLSVAGHVPDATPIGVKFPMTLDPSALHLFDASGALYPVEVKQGHLVAGGGVAIGDVSPGSAALPAGAVVTITGSNFTPDTKIKFGEVRIDAVRYVSPTRLDVVLGGPADMHGMFIKASNPDGSKATYFSYQRTFAAARSADPVLQYAVPLVSPPSRSTAVVAFAAPAANVTNGVALQNIGTSVATVSLELLDAAGSVAGTAQVTVPPNAFVVQSLSELFGPAPAGASSVIISSPTAPIEVLGIAADTASGTAMPVLAQ